VSRRHRSLGPGARRRHAQLEASKALLAPNRGSYSGADSAPETKAQRPHPGTFWASPHCEEGNRKREKKKEGWLACDHSCRWLRLIQRHLSRFSRPLKQAAPPTALAPARLPSSTSRFPLQPEIFPTSRLHHRRPRTLVLVKAQPCQLPRSRRRAPIINIK
jgi:hypothetical protein